MTCLCAAVQAYVFSPLQCLYIGAALVKDIHVRFLGKQLLDNKLGDNLLDMQGKECGTLPGHMGKTRERRQ